MSILKTLKKVVTGTNGGFLNKVFDTVKDYIPDPAMKAELEAKLMKLEMDRQRLEDEAIHQAAVDIDRRVAEYEGTAKDLKDIPLLGAFMLFLRGSQRILWGYGTFYIDVRWLFGIAEFTDRQEVALITINILVLGFLFGERAVKNVMPFITQFLAVKKG